MYDRERLRPWTLSIFTFCLVFFPMYLYYRRFRVGAAFYFLAGDAFYYLDVARFSQGHSFFTFDGVHATNGFHPLWQFLLTWLAHFPKFSFSGHDPVAHFFLLDLVIVSVGYGLLSVFAAKQLRRFWLVPLALCPGLTWFLAGIANSNYLSAWSYVNGMESGLSLLFFGLVLLFFRRKMPDGWKLWLGTLFLGLAILARLDDVFFLLAFFAYSVWFAPRQRIGAALPYVLPSLMITAYMLYNHITVGAYLPVSGVTKSSFALVRNLLWTIYAMLPASWDPQPFPQAPLFSYSNWAELTMRLFQLWFPILLCGGYLLVGSMRRSLRNRPVLSCLCVGALAKGLYSLLFVVVWSQGSWYYPVSIFTCNILLAVVLDKVVERGLRDRPRSSHPILRNAGILSLVAVFAWFCFFGLIAHKDAERYGRESFHTYSRGPQIAQDIRSAGASSYLELQDGLISYATGMPSSSALGLAIDVDALKAKKEGRFFDLMDRRGVHIIVASGSYIPGMNRILQSGIDPGDMLGDIRPSEYARYSIQIGPHDEDNDITIYRIVKKMPEAAANSSSHPH